jgi:hypothetical protein
VDTCQEFSNLAVKAFSAIMSEVFGGLGHALPSNFVWGSCWMVSVGAEDSNLGKEPPVQTYETVFGVLYNIVRRMNERMTKLTAIIGCLFQPL